MPLSSLEPDLRRIGASYSGSWTCAVTDIDSGEHIGIDEDRVMVSASLAKVPVLVALYQAVHEGRVSLDQRVTYEPRHRSFGSGVLARLSPGVEMSMRDAAVLMIIISDNSATNICVDFLGLEYINAQMRGLGFENTILFRRWEFDENTKARDTWVSTARETSALLALIARHEAVSPEASEDMLRIMRRQDYRHELSRNLPWSEMNTLPDHANNWVAEKGGSSPGGIRCGGSIFHTAHGCLAIAAFCEGGTAGGTGRESEGNVLLGALGEAAWRYLGDARSR